MDASGLPDGLEYVRTTDVFDNDTMPAGLRRAHRVAEGVWGRLVVHSGQLTFVFDDQPHQPIRLVAGGKIAIPPGRLHHVEPDGPATFAVEFHRIPTATAQPAAGQESTGLAP